MMEKKVKIGDYGDSKVLSPERISMSAQSRRDSKYMAPELQLLKEKSSPNASTRITKEIDIYSLGCMMWECTNLLRIGEEHNDESTSPQYIVWEGVKRAQKIRCNGPLVLCDLIQECLKFNLAGLQGKKQGYDDSLRMKSKGG